MATTAINFMDDLPLIRQYLAERIRAQTELREPISAIEVGFRLCQAGLLVYHFDTRPTHDRDGEWTMALDGPTLELAHWQTAYDSAGEHGVSFVLPDGTRRDVPPGAGDEAVAGIFGQMLLAITLDAAARGIFNPLNLRGDCQIDVDEFDGMWAWPPEYDDVGRTNLLRDLKATRLPL